MKDSALLLSATLLIAGSIELWQNYKGFPLEPVDRLKQWAALLDQANGH